MPISKYHCTFGFPFLTAAWIPGRHLAPNGQQHIAIQKKKNKYSLILRYTKTFSNILYNMNISVVKVSVICTWARKLQCQKLFRKNESHLTICIDFFFLIISWSKIVIRHEDLKPDLKLMSTIEYNFKLNASDWDKVFNL